MLCYQCEQTMNGVACTAGGVCGKDEATSDLQDLLYYASEGIALYARAARQLGKDMSEADIFVIKALFTTVTNVNFDPARLMDCLKMAAEVRDRARAAYLQAAQAQGRKPEALGGPATWVYTDDQGQAEQQGRLIGIQQRIAQADEVIVGLQELVAYGLKGAAAYADHAAILGYTDPAMFARFSDRLAWLADDPRDANELLGAALDVGELNYEVMELLDKAHNETFGSPEPTAVRVTPVAGKAIVVSGHDLLDLKLLLEQTKDTGIKIYTHGEMLPAHAYPELKKYDHLVGNYGGAWQRQGSEFKCFPGAVLMTTNCIQKPKDEYFDRIFTTGLVAWPGVRHIGADKDFSPVIEAALAAPGFAEDEPEKTIMVGFGHNAVMSVAETVVGAVKNGAIRHFFLVGGCDGAKPGRNYYTDLCQQIPDDCVILTLACGKFRFNKLDFGDIGGIPRLLDVGQCNDAYSAIRIAVALAEAFDCGVNDLPLSLVLSWYEQKAVAILLTLLYLGIQDIRLGPSLPAFVKPAVLDILVEKFAIKPIGTPEEDLRAILGA